MAARMMTGRAAPGSRRRRASAGLALIGLGLAVAGCSQALPLGPRPPAQHHLATAIVLKIVRVRPAAPAGSCPAGSTRLPPEALSFPGAGQCYRQLDQPLTVTSATVVYVHRPAANQQPANYGLLIRLPAAGRAALLAISTKAYHGRDSLAVIVGDRTWGVPVVLAPFTGGQFEIPAQSQKQALQLQRTLVPTA